MYKQLSPQQVLDQIPAAKQGHLKTLDFTKSTSYLRHSSKMASELSEEEKKVKNGFETVCRKLNMDSDSMEAAWTSYDKIKDNYTLEVR